jgi:hypothetical protein
MRRAVLVVAATVLLEGCAPMYWLGMSTQMDADETQIKRR